MDDDAIEHVQFPVSVVWRNEVIVTATVEELDEYTYLPASLFGGLHVFVLSHDVFKLPSLVREMGEVKSDGAIVHTRLTVAPLTVSPSGLNSRHRNAPGIIVC